MHPEVRRETEELIRQTVDQVGKQFPQVPLATIEGIVGQIVKEAEASKGITMLVGSLAVKEIYSRQLHKSNGTNDSSGV